MTCYRVERKTLLFSRVWGQRVIQVPLGERLSTQSNHLQENEWCRNLCLVCRFLSNRQRMNVALTRCKRALYILGHLDSLTVSSVTIHICQLYTSHGKKDEPQYMHGLIHTFFRYQKCLDNSTLLFVHKTLYWPGVPGVLLKHLVPPVQYLWSLALVVIQWS